MRIRKTVLLVLPILASALILTGFHGCGAEEESEGNPTVKIVSPAQGAKIKGPDVFIEVAVNDFEFGSEAAKVSAAQHEGGHVHIFLDEPKGLDADAIETMTKYDTLTLKNVAVGPHYIIVQGATLTHADYEGMKDSVSFTVE